jgi:hypothetical protein
VVPVPDDGTLKASAAAMMERQIEGQFGANGPKQWPTSHISL